MNVLIDKAGAGDAEAIAETHLAGLRASYGGLIPADVSGDQSLAARARHWRLWLRRSRAVTLVARVDGAVVGFCALHPNPDGDAAGAAAEVVAIFVRPSHWRLGLGRRLGARMMAEAASHGFSDLVLWVLEPNDRARRFYESLGFRSDGKERILSEEATGDVRDVHYRKSVAPDEAPAESLP